MRMITVFDSTGRDTGIWHKGDDNHDLMARARESIADVTGVSCMLLDGVVRFRAAGDPWTYTIDECADV